MRDRLIIGITGASGVVYGVRLLALLAETGFETHLVMTPAAEVTLAHETDFSAAEVKALADRTYNPRDIAAAISSGSFRTRGMIVAPCSVRSLSEIAWGTTSGLLTRAADVTLKEGRPLVLLVRETPLHAGHLRAMSAATENGAVVMPPVPAFYARPAGIEQMVDQTVGRALDLLGIELDRDIVHRWGEDG